MEMGLKYGYGVVRFRQTKMNMRLAKTEIQKQKKNIKKYVGYHKQPRMKSVNRTKYQKPVCH